MKAIQALLGHASYSLTADTYTSLMPQFAKEAADAPVALVPRKDANQGPSQDDNSAAAEMTSDAAPEEPAKLYLVKPDDKPDASGDNGMSGDNKTRDQGVA